MFWRMTNSYIKQYTRILGRGRRTGRHYRFKCPFPGCDGYDKETLTVSPDSGYWFCYHCHEVVPGKDYENPYGQTDGGTWQEFVQMVGDDPALWPSNGVEVEETKIKKLPAKELRKIWSSLIGWAELLPEDADKIRARGIEPVRAGCVSSTLQLLQKMVDTYGEEKLEQAGLGYVDKDNLFRPGKCIEPGRILIPYFKGDEIRYFVGWMKCPDQEPFQDDEEYAKIKKDWVKCAAPSIYPTQVYGEIPENAPLLIVTEGQIKAESAIQRGFPCVGLTGMGAGHKSLATECAKKLVKKVIVLFDTQLDDQENVDYEADRLAREFIKKDIPVFRAILPLELSIDEGKKTDIDSYLLNHSIYEFITVLEESRPYCFIEVDDEDEAIEEEVDD